MGESALDELIICLLLKIIGSNIVVTCTLESAFGLRSMYMYVRTSYNFVGCTMLGIILYDVSIPLMNMLHASVARNFVGRLNALIYRELQCVYASQFKVAPPPPPPPPIIHV